MEFDSRDDIGTPAHDRHTRLGSSWLLVLGLALFAVGAGTLLLTTPVQEQKPVIHAARFP